MGRHGHHPHVIPIQDSHPFRIGRQRFDQLLFGGGNGLNRTQTFQVYRANNRQDAYLWPGQLAQQRDFAAGVHAHLQNSVLVFRAQLEQRQGQADLVVVAALGLQRQAALGENGMNQLFTGGFANAAGDAHDTRRQLRPPGGGNPL